MKPGKEGGGWLLDGALEGIDLDGGSEEFEGTVGTDSEFGTQCDEFALFLEVEVAFARARAEDASGSGEGRALERWLRVFEAASRARSELGRRNLNPQLVVEGLLLDLRASA